MFLVHVLRCWFAYRTHLQNSSLGNKQNSIQPLIYLTVTVWHRIVVAVVFLSIQSVNHRQWPHSMFAVVVLVVIVVWMLIARIRHQFHFPYRLAKQLNK